MSDFFTTDPVKFLNEKYARQITHSEVFSIVNMSEAEVKESLIDDILSVTMFEKQTNQKVRFDFKELTRFIPKQIHHIVEHALQDIEIQKLITHIDGEYRINPDTASLKAAMDFCGCYYSGFEVPEGVELFRLDLEKLAVKDDVQSLINSVYMDVMTNSPTSDSVH